MFSPLELVLNVAKPNTEEKFLTDNLINFFDLKLNNELMSQNAPVFAKTKKIIEYLNFIRFEYSLDSLQSTSSSKSTKNKNHLLTQDRISNFSIILQTSNTLNRIDTIEQNNQQNDSKSTNWSYHYKVEMNDEYGRPIARQLFYKLNNLQNKAVQFPLCCRSNWQTPSQLLLNSSPLPALNTMQSTSLLSAQTATNNNKYIIRLNINCKNYDLMLFFYRLLFDKCPNFSKKDFSLFVLVQATRETQIEFQLSLKHDSSVQIAKLANYYLVYNITDRSTFENVIRLLDEFVEEVVKDRVYSVLDPDQNRIYLIDSSNKSPMYSLGNSFSHMKTIGLADKYFSNLLSEESQKMKEFKSDSTVQQQTLPQHPLSYSPNSNASSSGSGSETNSFDSGRWSCSSSSNGSSSTNMNSLIRSSLNRKLTEFSKPTRRQQESSEIIKSSGAKKLLNRVNNRSNKSLSAQNHSNLLLKASEWSEEPAIRNENRLHLNRNYFLRINENLADLELNELMRKANNNSMWALNALKYKNFIHLNDEIATSRLSRNLTGNRPMSTVHFHSRQSQNEMGSPVKDALIDYNKRCRSALNEPILAFNQNERDIESSKSALIENTLNRKKSKSVTFMDSIGNLLMRQDLPSSNAIERNFNHYQQLKHNKHHDLVQRPKSTIPFSQYNKRSLYKQFNQVCSSSDSEESSSEPNERIFYCKTDKRRMNSRQELSNLLKTNTMESRKQATNCAKSMMNKKLNVGVTPESRFRRSHTLDMLRSTRMPLNSAVSAKTTVMNDKNEFNDINKMEIKNDPFYLNCKHLIINNKLPIARF